jgi:uncharacterized membrane protein YgdD (TMEM256/DUF423 family)
MHKSILKTGILLSALSVVLGAFAAHGLKKIVSQNELLIFETGVKYQFYHSFALIIAAMLFKEYNSQKIILAAKIFVIGILLFSGSLYLLSIMPQYPILGMITPFGGISFITGWLLLFSAVKANQ